MHMVVLSICMPNRHIGIAPCVPQPTKDELNGLTPLRSRKGFPFGTTQAQMQHRFPNVLTQSPHRLEFTH